MENMIVRRTEKRRRKEMIKIRTRRIALTHSPSGKLERKIQTSETWIEDITTKIREGEIEVLRLSKATVTSFPSK